MKIRNRTFRITVLSTVLLLLLASAAGLYWQRLQQQQSQPPLRTYDARLLHAVDGRARYWTENGTLLHFQGGASLVQPRLGAYAANLDKSDRSLSLLNRDTGEKIPVDTGVLDCRFNAQGTLLYYFKSTDETFDGNWGAWYLYQVQDRLTYQVTNRVRQDHFWFSPNGRSFAYLVDEWKGALPKLQIQTVSGKPQTYTLPLQALPLTLPDVQDSDSPIALLVELNADGTTRLYQAEDGEIYDLTTLQPHPAGSQMQWFANASGAEYLLQWGNDTGVWIPKEKRWKFLSDQTLHWLVRNAEVYWTQSAQWGSQLASVWYFGGAVQPPRLGQLESGNWVFRNSPTELRELPKADFHASITNCQEGPDGVFYVRTDEGEVWEIHPNTDSVYRKTEFPQAIQDVGAGQEGKHGQDERQAVTFKRSFRIAAIWADPACSWIYQLTDTHVLFRLRPDGSTAECIAQNLPPAAPEHLYFARQTGQVWYQDTAGCVWTQQPGEAAQKLTDSVVDFVPVDAGRGTLLLAENLRKNPVDLVDLYYWTPESGRSGSCAEGIYHPFSRFHYTWLEAQGR